MKKSTSDYIAEAKRVLGDPHMSDRKLGELLGGFSQPSIGNAKAGYMSDHVAMEVGELLEQKKVIPDAGEVLLVARALREKNERIRAVLLRYAGKVLATVPSKAVSALSALAVALGLLVQPQPANAAVGGEGVILTLKLYNADVPIAG